MSGSFGSAKRPACSGAVRLVEHHQLSVDRPPSRRDEGRDHASLEWLPEFFRQELLPPGCVACAKRQDTFHFGFRGAETRSGCTWPSAGWVLAQNTSNHDHGGQDDPLQPPRDAGELLGVAMPMQQVHHMKDGRSPGGSRVRDRKHRLHEPVEIRRGHRSPLESQRFVAVVSPGCRRIVGRLAREGTLRRGLTPAVAADLLWALTSLRTWEDLVLQRRRSPEQYEQRLCDVLLAILTD
jgi:hypothetical protein